MFSRIALIISLFTVLSSCMTLTEADLADPEKEVKAFSERDIENYRESILFDPEDAVSWNKLGYIYYKLNRYDEAVYAYNEALHLDSKASSGTVWGNLIDAYNDLEQYDKAKEVERQQYMRSETL